MSWTLEVDKTLNIIVLTFSGISSSAENIDATSARINLVKKTGLKKLLIDVTDVEVEPSVASTLFNIVDKTYEQLRDKIAMMIAVTTPKSPNADKVAHFYETVCINRGHDCRKFKTRDEAVEWLLKN